MKTWDLSKHIRGYIDVAWMIIGVFNKVFYETEKNSRNPCDFSSIQQFQTVVDELLLKDVEAIDYLFTWSNWRHNDNFVEERLDRALATEDCLEIFPDVIVTNRVWDGFDHFTIIIELKGKLPDSKNIPAMRRFQFETKWVQEEKFNNVMKEVWEEAYQFDTGQWGIKCSMVWGEAEGMGFKCV